MAACAHPVAGTHESAVHGLPSLQMSGAPPTQTPAAQKSVVVQVFASVHFAWLLTCLQVPSQRSSVHALLSLHAAVLGVWTHKADLHVSAVHRSPSSQPDGDLPWVQPVAVQLSWVHGLASSHWLASGVNTQPDLGLQLSAVQAMPSVQIVTAPGKQMSA